LDLFLDLIDSFLLFLISIFIPMFFVELDLFITHTRTHLLDIA
jgi:hypothetical protein